MYTKYNIYILIHHINMNVILANEIGKKIFFILLYFYFKKNFILIN